MQSNQSRVLVALGSVAAIVVLLIVFAGGGGGDSDDATVVATTTAIESDPDAITSDTTSTDQAEEKPEPEFEKIEIVGGEPKGGVADLSYEKGDVIRLEVVSDLDEEVHVHGYDLFEEVAAGGSARFVFEADIEGVFEVELETSAMQVAQLTVSP